MEGRNPNSAFLMISSTFLRRRSLGKDLHDLAISCGLGVSIKVSWKTSTVFASVTGPVQAISDYKLATEVWRREKGGSRS